MAWYDKAIDTLGRTIANYMVPSGGLDSEHKLNREYFTGDHPNQLKVKSGQYDDNLTLNYIGLAISRGVSRLFNNGIEFKLPDGAEKQQKYLDDLWDTNGEEGLLYQFGLNGAVYGTPYIKIVPEGIINKFTATSMPRLITLDPEITRIEVNPFDVDEVEKYIVEFTVENITYKEVTRRAKADDFLEAVDTESWIVEHFILSNKTGGKFVMDPDRPPVQWPYQFPPIIHCKNLPGLKAKHGCYGATDFEWALGAQDKLNFADSNINKTIRLNAAPPTIATGFITAPEINTGPGSLFWTANQEAKVYNLTANADIMGSRAFASDLQSAVFELMREVPPSVIQQLGSGLTNFVMRVVYADAIEKTDTKRELYGDCLLELNRRLLVLNGYEGEASQPGIIEWGDALPTNPQEQIQEDTFLLANGLASKKTIAAKYDIDYDAELELLAEDKRNANALGGDMLREFLAGRNNAITG